MSPQLALALTLAVGLLAILAAMLTLYALAAAPLFILNRAPLWLSVCTLPCLFAALSVCLVGWFLMVSITPPLAMLLVLVVLSARTDPPREIKILGAELSTDVPTRPTSTSSEAAKCVRTNLFTCTMQLCVGLSARLAQTLCLMNNTRETECVTYSRYELALRCVFSTLWTAMLFPWTLAFFVAKTGVYQSYYFCTRKPARNAAAICKELETPYRSPNTCDKGDAGSAWAPEWSEACLLDLSHGSDL